MIQVFKIFQLKIINFFKGKRISALDGLHHKYFDGATYVESVHKTCAFGNELTDTNVIDFVNQYCGGE